MARIDDYKESFRLASEKLKQADLPQLADRAGAETVGVADGTTTLRLRFLDIPFIVRVGGTVDIVVEGRQVDVPLPEKILISHYLLHCVGKSPAGELITFRQIPDGQFYFDAFQRRARDPFLATFGKNPELFVECARALGGVAVDAGDVGMSFRALPNIEVRIALWKGDDEFPPEAGLLFDSSISRNLPVEDIAVLSGMLVYRLMGIARTIAK